MLAITMFMGRCMRGALSWGPQQKGAEGLFDVGWVTGIMEEAFNG